MAGIGRFRYWLLVIGVIAIAGLLWSAPAALAASPASPQITGAGCMITVQFDANAPQTAYRVEMWDDLVKVFDQTRTSTAAGETLTFSHTFAAVGGLVPGVGIYVFEAGSEVFGVDRYTGIDASCAPAEEQVVAGCPVGIPSGSVGGAFVAPAPLYSVPDQLVEAPPITLEPGKTVWVIGLDDSGRYYKIFWACQYLWVPASTLGPNYDEVWHGTPLPTRTVET